MAKTIRVKNGYRLLMNLYSDYRVKIYEYNSKIKETGYYLKPIHIVHKSLGNKKIKYLYFGRYWYKVVKKNKGFRWIYVGREKPDPMLPDPPIIPFEGIGVVVDGEDIMLDEKGYRVLNEVAKIVMKESLDSLINRGKTSTEESAK